jgi:hypothetical protein
VLVARPRMRAASAGTILASPRPSHSGAGSRETHEAPEWRSRRAVTPAGGVGVGAGVGCVWAWALVGWVRACTSMLCAYVCVCVC